MIVGEVPEKNLGALERSCVVERLEGLGGVVHQVGEAMQHRSVQGLGNGNIARISEAQSELRRVENLDRQPAPDLHLSFVEGGVGARAPR